MGSNTPSTYAHYLPYVSYPFEFFYAALVLCTISLISVSISLSHHKMILQLTTYNPFTATCVLLSHMHVIVSGFLCNLYA